MFGLGVGELLIILVIVLVIFGAGKLPEIGEGLGRGIRSFRKEVKRPDEIDITPRRLLAALRAPLAAGLAMFASVWLVGVLLGEPGLLVLVLQVLTGIVAYPVALYALNPAVAAELRALLGLLRQRTPTAAPRLAGLDEG